MQCPKCGAPHDAGDAECRRCGVVFAKLAQRAAIADGEPAAAEGLLMMAGALLWGCLSLSRASRRDE